MGRALCSDPAQAQAVLPRLPLSLQLGSQHGSDLSWGAARQAQGLQACGPVAFGEAFAVRSQNEAVVAVARRRPIEQRIQKRMQMRSFREVHAANDMVDALQGVVMDAREVIARRKLFAGEN